jgi:hypothetical protein
MLAPLVEVKTLATELREGPSEKELFFQSELIERFSTANARKVFGNKVECSALEVVQAKGFTDV